LVAEVVDEVLVLTVKGPFNCFHTYNLKDVVAEHVERGHSRFVIDINPSGPMDATAVDHLVSSYKTVTDSGGILAFADSRETSNEFWAISGVNKFIDIYPSAEDAVRVLRQTTISAE